MSKPVEIMAAAEVRDAVLADVNAERERLKAAQEEHRGALAQLHAENEGVRAEYRQARAAAKAELKPIPQYPDLPDGQGHRDALHEGMMALSELAEMERQALASALPELEATWQSAREPLDAQAREIVTKSEELAREYAAWWSLLKDARRAVEITPNSRVSGGPSERMRQRPTVVDLVDAARGIDLCGVTDHRLPPTAIRHDDGEVELIETTRLHLQR